MRRRYREALKVLGPLEFRLVNAIFARLQIASMENRVGVYRVMEILRQEGIKASFFVNGHTVEAFPDMMKQIVAEGHELCSENWRHEYVYMMTQKEQRNDIKRTVNVFQKVLGFKPQGYIMPGERPTDDTPKTLIDLGYKY